MSKENSLSINCLDVIERLKKVTGKKTDQEIAEILNLTKANFSQRKQRNSLIDVLVIWGIKNNVNLNWLLKGNDEKKILTNSEFFPEINKWISEILTQDKRNKNWFEVEFEKAFPDYLRWKEEKESQTEADNKSQFSKIA